MNNLEEMPKIQDFILEINNISNKPNKVEYSLVLENSCDFIISRKTSRTEKIMAIIISQNLYYIKDNNTGEIINLTYDNAKNFFKEMGENIIVLNEVKWIKEINKNSYDKIMQITSDWIYVEMCKNNIYFYKRDMADYRRYVQSDIKFLKYIFSSIPDVDNTYKYTLSFIDFAYLVKEKLGGNEARFLVEKYIDSSVKRVDFINEYRRHLDGDEGMVWKILQDKRFNLDYRRFITYLFYDLYVQGKDYINSDVLRRYKDYLEMQYELYGEVKEKYPKFFETEHDVVTLKYSIARIKVEEKLFNEGMEQYKNLGYMDSKYLIRVPDKPEELKFEGQKLNHCVGSYGSRVASGQCGVVFLRRKEQEDEPYITIEVIKDRIVQMQGAGRRQPNTEEMNFISKWAYKKQLRIAV